MIFDDEIKILYNLESMVLLVHSVLDLAAYVYSELLLNERNNSFNKFIKKLNKEDSKKNIVTINEFFKQFNNSDINVYILLCGTQKGRVLRNIIVHQLVLTLEYLEIDSNSENESLHVIVDKKDIPYQIFINII